MGMTTLDTPHSAGRPWMPILRWSPPLLTHLVMTIDAILLLMASGIAGPLPQSSRMLPSWFHALVVVGLITIAVHQIMVRLGAYQLPRYRQRARPIVDILVAVPVGVAAGLGIAFLLMTPTGGDQRWLLTWAGGAVVLLALFRQAVRFVVARGVRSGSLQRKVAIVGATDLAEQLVEQMLDPSQSVPYRVVGVFDDRAAGRRPPAIGNFQVGGSVADLCTYAEAHPVDLIVIALPWSRAVQIWTMMQRLQWISADVMIPLDKEGFNPRAARVATVAGHPALQVMQQPLRGARVLLKLAQDYVVAAVALVLAAPVMLLAAVAVRLDSPGPILFRQPRVGFNRQVFDVFKFRTMYVDPTDSGIVGVDRDSPRITRTGAILRRLSIDELPQLFNVLRGEMSIVGPRPHVPGMKVGDQQYTDAVQEYAARYRIKPGITGWAQINGMRGGIHTVDKARRGVDLDMHYIEHWSMWFDAQIMVRTLLIGMAGRDVF